MLERQSDLENYIRLIMQANNKAISEAEDITFSKMEELMNVGDKVGRRFFSDGGVASFLKGEVETRELSAGKTGLYEVLPPGDDFPEARKWADQPPEKIREIIQNYKTIFERMDKDMSEREDWKTFWAKLEKEAGDDVGKLNKIVEYKEGLLSSYRFRVISMLFRNMNFQIQQRAAMNQHQPMEVSTKEMIESQDWLQDLNGVTFTSRLGKENPLVKKLQTNMNNKNKLIALAERDIVLFESSLKTLFARDPSSIVTVFKQILTDTSFTRQLERLNGQSLADILSRLINETLDNDPVPSRRDALNNYHLALMKHIIEDEGSLSTFTDSLHKQQYADIQDRPTKQQFVIELLRLNPVGFPPILEKQSLPSLLALQRTIGIGPDVRDLYSTFEYRDAALETLNSVVEKKIIATIRDLNAYIIERETKDTYSGSPFGQDKTQKIEAASDLRDILAKMLAEKARQTLAKELDVEFKKIESSALSNPDKFKALTHGKLGKIARESMSIEHFENQVKPQAREKKSPEIKRKIAGLIGSTSRISGRFKSGRMSSHLSFRGKKPKEEVRGTEKEEPEKGVEKLAGEQRAEVKASPRRAWEPTRANTDRVVQQRSFILRAEREKTPEPQNSAVEEFKARRQRAREEAEAKAAEAEKESTPQTPRPKGPGSNG